jgi:hypothetical protein
MGPAIYIPWGWFDPLPEWAVPWVAAATVVFFVWVVIWAIRQRGH